MCFRPLPPRGDVNHKFASDTIQADCMIVLGISYHISLPMETLPIVNKDHIKTRLWVGSRVKTMILILELYLNKNSNMILHEFHSFDQLVISSQMLQTRISMNDGRIYRTISQTRVNVATRRTYVFSDKKFVMRYMSHSSTFTHE